MNSLKTFACKTAVGTLAIAALLILAPKTAKSVAAALVQVTNTASSPAIMQPVHAMASQLVTLTLPGGNWISQHDQAELVQVPPNAGLSSTTYAVPSGQNLVITEVDILDAGTSGSRVAVGADVGGTFVSEGFGVTAPGAQYRFASGMVFSSGQNVWVVDLGTDGISVTLHGYLTAN